MGKGGDECSHVSSGGVHQSLWVEDLPQFAEGDVYLGEQGVTGAFCARGHEICQIELRLAPILMASTDLSARRGGGNRLDLGSGCLCDAVWLLAWGRLRKRGTRNRRTRG